MRAPTMSDLLAYAVFAAMFAAIVLLHPAQPAATVPDRPVAAKT